MKHAVVAALRSWLHWGVENGRDSTCKRKRLMCNVGALIGIVSLLLYDAVFLYSGSPAAKLAFYTHLPFYLGFALVPSLNRGNHPLAASWLLVISAMGVCLFPMVVAFGTYFDHHFYFILMAVAPSAVFPSRQRLAVIFLFVLNTALFLWFKEYGLQPAVEITATASPEVVGALTSLLTLMVLLTLAGFFWSHDFFASRSERELERLSMTDNLTQLPNRRNLENLYRQELARARRSGNACAVAIMDIDLFKQVNDTNGHDAGDMVIRHVAQVTQRNLRAGNLIARLGGDEFVILMPDTTLSAAGVVMERIRAAINATTLRCDGRMLPVTVSLGVAQVRPDEPMEAAIRRADQCLYAAKHGGRNQVKVEVASNDALLPAGGRAGQDAPAPQVLP